MTSQDQLSREFNGNLKIRSVRSKGSEAEARYVAIDTFDGVTSHYKYFCGCEVFKYTNKQGKTYRGNQYEPPKLLFTDCAAIDDFDYMEACLDDVFEKPDIPLYIGLSQALKNNGYIFNKKLGQLYKKTMGKTK